MNKKQGAANIKKNYKKFNFHIQHLWDAFYAIDQGMLLSRKIIKKERSPVLKIPVFEERKFKKFTVNTQCGLVEHILKVRNPRIGLFEIISIFEQYLSEILTTVYINFPGKLISNNSNGESETKYLGVILKYDNKEEMIEKIAEEKVRNLMYASMREILVKDRGKLEIGDLFSKDKKLINEFVELCARRNLFVHNEGRVNKIYLDSVPWSSLKIGEMIKLDKEYISSGIKIVEKISKKMTVHVLKKFYKIKLKDIKKDFWKEEDK